MQVIKGKVWVLGNNVDTDQILPGYAMVEPFEKLGEFAMAGVPELDFRAKVSPGDIIVAGENLGCGSSREQAPVALQQAGVGLLVASSFARIFRRNAINIGLPVLAADIASLLKTGDEIEVDLSTGIIRLPTGSFQAPPLSPTVLETLQYGGLIGRVRAELGIR